MPAIAMPCARALRGPLFVLLAALILGGCIQANVSVFGTPGAAYREQTVSGEGQGKILLLGIDGLITEHPAQGLLGGRPGTVQEVAAQLKLARKDKDIKAVLLRVDSPGGTTTASDIIYNELAAYKAETGVKVVAVMMGLCTSGGYYVSLPADHIAAHPTTITGSVGVIFLQPRVAGLLEKIGVGVDVSKSGANKDMGSPFRPATDEEKRMVDAMTKAQAARFLSLVEKSRKPDPAAMTIVGTARVFSAQEAKDLGLVDSIGYMADAVTKAAELSGLPKNARVVSYRRKPGPNATYYQSGAEGQDARPALVNTGLEGLTSALPPQSGAYFLWMPGLGR